MKCAEIPKIYTWSSSQEKLFAFKTVNKNLMETELAPVVYSNSLLAASLGENYKNVLLEKSEVNLYDNAEIEVDFFKKEIIKIKSLSVEQIAITMVIMLLMFYWYMGLMLILCSQSKKLKQIVQIILQSMPSFMTNIFYLFSLVLEKVE